MQDKDNNSYESINDILESIAKGSSETGESAEFVLGKERSSLGLVFENTTEDDVVEEGLSSEKINVNFEIEKAPDKDVEFSIPDKFEINDKFNTPAKEENLPRMATAYVPRFTGAAESYRMSNDPRPRPKPVKPVELKGQNACKRLH